MSAPPTYPVIAIAFPQSTNARRTAARPWWSASRLAALVAALVFALALPLAGCGGSDFEGNPGDYDDTCFSCESICTGCDPELAAICLDECAACQGFSDCFMWLEAQTPTWGCDSGHTQWSSASCE